MARMVCGRVTHRNGTHDMWVGDSSEWNAWYAGGDQGALG